MAAFAVTYLPRPQRAAGALLAILLAACSAPRAPLPILAERCLAVSTALPISLRVSSPGGGTLRIAMRQRGIALTSSLVGDTASTVTESPDDRYGLMTLLADSRRAGVYSVRILSRDSPDIIGEVCVSAELVDPSDRVRLAAERAFAAAGRATRARHWQAAFADYLMAARGFDHFDRQRSAAARQAMAQLAYRQSNRARDSYVLAALALADFGPDADPGLRSVLTELQATILMESKNADPDRRARVLQLLRTAGTFATRARFGARELARLQILRGFLEYANGDSHAAGEFFAQSAAQCKTLRDWECYARARQNSAEIAEDTGNGTLALQGYADALGALNPAVAPILAAAIWDNLGRLQGYMGLFSLGEQSLLNAIRLYARIGDCDGVRRTLSTLGSILAHVGNVDDALVYLYRATSHNCSALLSSTKEVTQQDFRASTAEPASALEAGANAVASEACGNLPAPTALSADGAASVFRALLAINYAATLETDPALAKRCLAAARPYALTPRLQLQLANAAGSAYIDSAEPARARKSFMHALDVADHAALAARHENRALAYLGLARAALLAHHGDAALRYSTRALLLGSARADVGQVVTALQVLSMSLQQAGERQRALQTLRAAANLIEQVPLDDLDAETRATFLATQHGVYEELTDLLVETARTGSRDDAADSATWTAFAVSERGRARSLQYAISQATNNDPASVHAHSAARFEELRARIAAIATSAQASGGWSAAVGQFETLPRSDQHTPTPVTADELVPQLDRLHATLVEYATGRNDMFAFVVDGGNMQVVPLGGRKEIAAAAAALYETLHDSERAAADIERAARQLARLALWPVTRLIGRQRVIFIPDDSLHTVPFAVLPWSEDPGASLVLQHAETSVAPSALFLMQPGARTVGSNAPRLELFGDPVLQADEWRRDCSESGLAAARAQARSPVDQAQSLPRLPGSRAEVLAIAEIARAARPSSSIRVRLGCMATPAALRQAAGSGPELLHIATHGYVDARRPRLSALVLSSDSAAHPAGGVFGLLDILDTPTTSRLVVLSACDTSRGRLLPGEGRLGLAQAFLQSGAASVVASYWRIDDAATASFMRSFYKFLLTERLPVAAALRRAQLEQSSATSAHDWGAFALFGWPDSTL